jgi:hypothetical protein
MCHSDTADEPDDQQNDEDQAKYTAEAGIAIRAMRVIAATAAEDQQEQDNDENERHGFYLKIVKKDRDRMLLEQMQILAFCLIKVGHILMCCRIPARFGGGQRNSASTGRRGVAVL